MALHAGRMLFGLPHFVENHWFLIHKARRSAYWLLGNDKKAISDKLGQNILEELGPFPVNPIVFRRNLVETGASGHQADAWDPT